jgi:hypothetical protein
MVELPQLTPGQLQIRGNRMAQLKLRRRVDPEAGVRRVLRAQLRDFRKKFGRDPLPGEPVFFDPDKDVPTEMTEERLREDMLEMLADGPPQVAYAYAKTGLLLIDGPEACYPPEDVAEWKAAIDEYFRLEEEGGEH